MHLGSLYELHTLAHRLEDNLLNEKRKKSFENIVVIVVVIYCHLLSKPQFNRHFCKQNQISGKLFN